MKNNYYQMLRGICVLLVLLIHVLYITDNSYINYSNIIIRRIINFAVPLFVFLAGYFIKVGDLKSFYIKKVFRIIIPLLLWKVIYIIVDPLYVNEGFINIIKNFILCGYHLYYLIVLVCLFIITPWLIKYIKMNRGFRLYLPLIVTIFYNLFITVYYIVNDNAFVLYNYYIFGWFSYYYLGLLLSIKKTKINTKLYFHVFMGLVFSIIEGILMYKKYGYYDLSVSQLTVFNSIYSLLICLLVYKNEFFVNNGNLFVKIGNYSYGMYLSHILFLVLIKKIYNINNLYFVNIIIVYILLVVVTFVFNYIYYNVFKKRMGGKI